MLLPLIVSDVRLVSFATAARSEMLFVGRIQPDQLSQVGHRGDTGDGVIADSQFGQVGQCGYGGYIGY